MFFEIVYQTRLIPDILEYFLYWFVQFPLNQNALPVATSEVKTKKEVSHKLPAWISSTTAMISPQKPTKPTKTKTTNIYLDLLNNYLTHFVPHGEQRKCILLRWPADADVVLL